MRSKIDQYKIMGGRQGVELGLGEKEMCSEAYREGFESELVLSWRHLLGPPRMPYRPPLISWNNDFSLIGALRLLGRAARSLHSRRWQRWGRQGEELGLGGRGERKR